MNAPARETTPLTIDEERAAHDLLDALPDRCDWEPIRPAEPRCEAEAIWILALSCGHVSLYCDRHRAMIQYIIDAPPSGIGCAQHAPAIGVDYEWRPLNV